MSKNTSNLKLYKKEPSVDSNDKFDITTMLNDNWDKIDQHAGQIEQRIEVNENARHSHGNKSVVDQLKQTDLNNIHSNTSERHNHSNKAVLDKINQSLINKWDTVSEKANQTDVDNNTSARHTHSNKSVIDNLQQSDLDNVNNLMSSVSRNSSKISGNSEVTIKLVKNLLEKNVIDTAPEGSTISIEDFNDNTEIDSSSTATYDLEGKKVVATGKQKLILKTNNLSIPISKPKVMIYLDEIKKAVLQSDVISSNIINVVTNGYNLDVNDSLLINGVVRDFTNIQGSSRNVDLISTPLQIASSGNIINRNGRNSLILDDIRYDLVLESGRIRIKKIVDNVVMDTVGVASSTVPGCIFYHALSDKIFVLYRSANRSVHVVRFNRDLTGAAPSAIYSDSLGDNSIVSVQAYSEGTRVLLIFSGAHRVAWSVILTIDSNGIISNPLARQIDSYRAIPYFSVESANTSNHMLAAITAADEGRVTILSTRSISGATLMSNIYRKYIMTGSSRTSPGIIYKKRKGSNIGRIFAFVPNTSSQLRMAYTDNDFGSVSATVNSNSEGLEPSAFEDNDGNIYVLYRSGDDLKYRIINDGETTLGEEQDAITGGVQWSQAVQGEVNGLTFPPLVYEVSGNNAINASGNYTLGGGFKVTLSGNPIIASEGDEVIIASQLGVTYNNIALEFVSYSEKSMENLIELSGVIPSSSEANIEVEFENNGVQLVGYFEGGV
jgi:hypothetical protein